jgi:orc1/cdc6 family replication initiation protein
MSQPILIDESLFDEAFIPERLVCREGQIKEIARCLNPATNGKSIRNIFLYGNPGVGKTLICRFILKNYFPKQSVFVNCWSNRTIHKVMESILLQLGLVIPKHQSSSDLVKRFESLKRKAIVCLDESDHLKDGDVLYTLTRNSCGIILISNQSSALSRVDARIKSSLLLNEIEFKQYTAAEILEILKERAAYGIRSTAVDGSILSLIAKLCSGDARIALQTLKIAAKEAESKNLDKITIEEIKSALKCTRKYRLSYLLKKLNEHERTIYEILKKETKMPSGKLYKAYTTTVNRPVVDRAYRSYMKRMVELGLVKVERTGRWKIYERMN